MDYWPASLCTNSSWSWKSKRLSSWMIVVIMTPTHLHTTHHHHDLDHKGLLYLAYLYLRLWSCTSTVDKYSRHEVCAKRKIISEFDHTVCTVCTNEDLVPIDTLTHTVHSQRLSSLPPPPFLEYTVLFVWAISGIYCTHTGFCACW